MKIGLRRAALMSGPLLWIAGGNIAPLIEMARISLLDTYPAAPGHVSRISLDNYLSFLQNSVYLSAFLRSLAYGATTTLAALIISYPLAYGIALKTPPRRRMRMLLLLIAPFWTSEIVRLFALMLLLANQGAVNGLLRWIGVLDEPLSLLFGPLSVVLGMLYIVLLAMLLPLYAALEKLPQELLDAAAGLGAGPWQQFLRVTLPLTREGIASGCSLVFLISLGALAAPMLLGGAGTTLFATTINSLFASSAGRWPLGAAFGLILLTGGLATAGLLVWVISPSALHPDKLRRA